MPDNAALTNRPRWWRGPTIWHRVTLVVGALAIGALLIAVTFCVLRLRETYILEARVNQLDGTLQHMLLQRTMLVTDIDNRLDLLERTVFGDVVPKIDRTKPGAPDSRFEAIMLRNGEELRQRVERLERWRLAMIE